MKEDMDIEHQHVIDELLHMVPEFAKVYKDHREYWGENMSYLLMSQLVDFIIDVITSSETTDADRHYPADTIERVMKFVEDSLTNGNESVKNLVALGFLENFGRTGTTYDLLYSYLGSTSRLVLKELEEGWEQLQAKLDDAK